MLSRSRALVALFMVLFLVGHPENAFGVDFASPVSYPVGTAATGLVVADFNGDGKLDLATANSGSGNVSILVGHGDGTLQEAVNFDAAVTSPTSLAVGDFDDDGKLDLAALDISLSALSVLLGNGNGSFQTAKSLALAFSPRVMIVTDFNLDGKSDIAISGSDPNTNTSVVNIFLGTGDGTFQSPTQTSVPGNPSLAAADVNRDGKPDLAISAGNGINIFMGSGDGTLQPGTIVAVKDIGSIKPSVSDFRVADVDNNDEVDLVVRSAGATVACGQNCLGATKVSLFLGGGSGSFGEELIIASTTFKFGSNQLPSSGSEIRGFVLGDFNGDEKLDVGYRRVRFSGGSFFEGQLGKGDGSFSPVLGFGPDISLAAVADLNSDKNGDLVVSVGDNSISVALNTSPTTGADLGIIAASASAEPVGIGINLTYTANLLNEGPRDSTGVTFTDTLPSGVNFVSATATQGNCAQSHLAVTCNLGSLASAFDATVTIVVSPTATGTITNMMSVLAAEGDPVSANNSAMLDTTVVPTFTLVVATAGAGSGTVTSDLGGINCPGTCSAPLAMGTAVSLTATAASGFTFTGWSGACFGTDACSVSMNADRNVTATFVPTPDFSLSAAAPSPTSVAAGHSAASTVTINSANGFNSAVEFACSVDPAPALAPTCSMNPSSATPAANGSASSTLTINTTPPTVALMTPPPSGWFYAIWLPMGGLAWAGIGFPPRIARRRILATLILCLVLTVGAVFNVSCGGSAEHQTTGGTPPGTYTITVAGASGSTQHSTTVTLAVQ